MKDFTKNVNLILCDLKKGSNEKRKELFDYTYNHLKVIALTYAKNKNDYEDILVDAYLKAFKYADSFDERKNGYNWLCKIVQNVAYDYNLKYVNENSLSDILEEASDFFDFEEKFLEKSTFLSEINKLPPTDRKLLYLRFWENLSYREIAKRLNLKKSTVHKKISELITELKNKLGEAF